MLLPRTPYVRLVRCSLALNIFDIGLGAPRGFAISWLASYFFCLSVFVFTAVMSLFLPSRTAMSRSPFCSWLGIAAGVPPAGKAFDFRRYFFFLPFFFFFFVTPPFFFILIDVRFCRLFIHPGPRLGSLRFRWVAVVRGFFCLFSGHLLFLRFSGFSGFSLPFYLMLADETTRLGWLDASRRFFFHSSIPL